VTPTVGNGRDSIGTASGANCSTASPAITSRPRPVSLTSTREPPCVRVAAGAVNASPRTSPVCSSIRAEASGSEVRSRSRVVPEPCWSRFEM
jgi:hypothetical protein